MTTSPTTPSDHGLRTAFPVVLLIALAVLAAVAPLTTDAYLPAFAQMAGDLDVSASSVQLTMTASLVGIALGQLGIGVLSDRVGRCSLLLWGSVLALATSIGTALSPDLPVLLITRLLQRLGDTAGMVLGWTVISDRSHGITAARAPSVVMAVQGVAPVVAPILGDMLVKPIGQRGILGVVTAFTRLLTVMVLLWVPESLPAERHHDGGLRMLLDGTREPTHDHVLVHLLFINVLSLGLLMAYLSATPFVLRSVLGMGTVTYTAVFELYGATVTVTIAVAVSLVRRFSQARQMRVRLTAGLVVDTIFAGICLTWLREPAIGSERMPLLVTVVALSLTHVACLRPSMDSAPVLALDHAGRQARTGSALLGFLQFVVGRLVNPLVGLTGEASSMAFSVVIVAVGAVVNVLAIFGLHERGEKQRLAVQMTEHRQRRLGQ